MLTIDARRPGFTLAELIVAMLVGAIVLALATSVGTRLQRDLTALRSRVAGIDQVRDGEAILAADLRGLSPTSNDIRAGAATDTSLEIRATIASAVVCAASGGDATLAMARGAHGAPGERPQPGDTLWYLDDADTVESWHSARIADVRASQGCPLLASDSASGALFDRGRTIVVSLSNSDASALRAGAPVRVLRPERYSLYRAGDGRWYLGLRDWNVASSQFNQIQPVSGPYRRSSATSGTRLRYFDSLGAMLPPASADTRGIARIEVVLYPDSTASDPRPSRDSLVLVVALRNRW